VDEFHELRGLGSDGLIYIKEDLMIPHQYTFYDLIASKARGKSGPLFHFDVHDDVRMMGDASIEKDESHAGKIVTKGWYERNKVNEQTAYEGSNSEQEARAAAAAAAAAACRAVWLTRMLCLSLLSGELSRLSLGAIRSDRRTR
jgi:hypothetical protein